MKTSFLLLPFLLFAFAAKPSPAAAAEAAPAGVLDTNGKELHSGTEYYILPVVRGRGGGLTLAATGNGSCPLSVVQDQHEVSHGFPLTFSPVNPKKAVVRLSTDHNIKFSAATTCVQSTVWKLDGKDESTGEFFVTVGGVEGNPGRETLTSWFKIEKYDDDYKLRFCPTVCDFCKVICRDVGIYVDEDGRRRLVLSDAPFKIMFKKA
ncbi:kunitz trypsin inhibitor 5-like [Malania oleifera]|uniref:kunitz trypsin inhibitor 5-like n=1 Tax=Malania oleifera TaxID=397392 RepID=UPI0025AE4811|nr:kunitz trypsin inhibitor 5-like [Malania oleifera]